MKLPSRCLERRAAMTPLRVTSLLLLTSLLAFLSWRLIFSVDLLRSGLALPMAGLVLEAKDNHGNPAGISRIPRIIHQTWRGEEIPEIYLPWIRSFREQNPEWEYWFWTDRDIDEFIAIAYPQFLALYRSYPGKGYRADAFRYLVLFEYGGVYADLDMESLRPLSNYIGNTDCFVSQEPHAHAHFLSPLGIPLVSNALLGCRPDHPFFRIVLENLHRRAGLFFWNDVLRATGPYMLTDIYRNYARKSGSHTSPDSEVTLADPDTFQPALDSSMVDSMRAMCIPFEDPRGVTSRESSQEHVAICRQVIGYDFKGSPAENSYTNHHWTHSWAGPRNDPYGVHNSIRKFDIRKTLS